MEYMSIANRVVLFILAVLFSFNSCRAQRQQELAKEYIYGKWQCVKIDKRGYQKYTWEQAQQLQSSILTIEKNKFYYNNIGFVEPCDFFEWKISKYDTTSLSGTILDIAYKKKDLSKIYVLEPTDGKGESACFNNCALFYLKQDTLINICGGYALFLIKSNGAKD